MITLNQYNPQGELEYTVADLNQDSQINFDGIDRITQTTNSVVNNGASEVRRSEIYVWPTNHQASARLVAKREVSTDGLQLWEVQRNNGADVTTRTFSTYDRPNRSRTVTTLAPENIQTIAACQDGRLQSVTRRNPAGTVQLGQTTYDYDPHGRLWHQTDARNGTTTYAYEDADRLFGVTTPAPGDGSDPQTATTQYDPGGRPWRITHPDHAIETRLYWPLGQLKQLSGARNYPVGYGYDAQGRLTSMTNWTTFDTAGQRVTTWTYDPQRGWLRTKRSPDNTGSDYDYGPAGRLKTRTWARPKAVGSSERLRTDYAYNPAGDLWTVSYSDGATAGTTNLYDRLGRLQIVTRNGIATTLDYNDAGQLTGETHAGGPLDGLAVHTGYDDFLRRHTLAPRATR